LTAAATATRRLKLGTGICLVVERDPIVTAKSVATVDRLSGGRFLFGIGGGWNAEEMANHGTTFKMRWRLLREGVLARKEVRRKRDAIRSPYRCHCFTRRPSGQRWTRLRRPASSAPSSACHPSRATPHCRASTPTRR